LLGAIPVSVHKDFDVATLWQRAQVLAFLDGLQQRLHGVGFKFDRVAKRGFGVTHRNGRIEQVL
jgi:hypothetical protein